MSTLRDRGRDLGANLFGDRYGYALWLGLLLMFGLYWRVGFFIADNYATANTLVAVADGQLSITKTPYSLTLGSQPGLHRSGGLLYGRNYGQVFLAVPLVWAFQALATIVAPRLLLLGIWTGLGLAFVTQLGEIGDDLTGFSRRSITAVGSAIVGLLFLAGVIAGTELPTSMLPLAAFQFSTMLAAATTGLVLYRLVGLWHDRAVALAAGITVGIASPIGFWASLPKRHVLVALLVLASVYAFARSRIAYRNAAYRRALLFRATVYVFAGFVTWIHAFEGFFLVATVGLVDIATARRNSASHLLVVALALFLAALPMLVTNYLISGNPVKPPRVLQTVGGINEDFVPENWETGGGDGGSGGADAGDGSGGSGDGSGGSGDGSGGSGDGSSGSGDGSSGSGDSGVSSDGSGGADTGDGSGGTGDGSSDSAGDGREIPVLSPLLDRLDSALAPVTSVLVFVPQALFGGVDVLREPARLSHIFLRSGYIPGVRYDLNEYEVIELTVLESAPVLGAFFALPALLARRLRERLPQAWSDPRRYAPRRQTDLLVVALALVFTIIYLNRLPLFSQLTVRYLMPTFPLALYGVVRLPAVPEAVRTSGRFLAGAFTACVAGGLILGLGAVAGLDLALGEAVQFHALLNLLGAVVCAGTVAGRTLVPETVSPRAVAAGLSLPAGLTAAYVLLSGLVYFQYGTFALDVVRVLVDALPTM